MNSRFLIPVEIKEVISREIKRCSGKSEYEGIVENEFIKVLSIKERNALGKKQIIITYRQKKRGGDFSTTVPDFVVSPDRIQKSGNCSVLAIDWVDENGNPIQTTRVGTDTNNFPGDFDSIYLNFYPDAKSYQIRFLNKSDDQ